MFSQSLLASVVKVLLVGGVMAGGAGGFYLVAENRSSSGDRDLLAATTSTAAAGALTATAASPSSSASPPTASATKAPGTATPQPPLTDTGYKAPDGSPLYKECIMPGAPLPPQIPTPSGGPDPIPTAPADPNSGATPPGPGEVPDFDPFALSRLSTSGWPTYASPCFRFVQPYPPDWSLLSPFTIAGYQQGEAGVYRSPDQRIKLDVYYYYSPVDALALAMAGNAAGSRSYLLRGPWPLKIQGRDGVAAYALIREGGAAYVKLGLLIRERAGWYYSALLYVNPPYDKQGFMAALTALEGVLLP